MDLLAFILAISAEGVTDEQVQTALNAYIAEHPEAVTTVTDGSITKAKLDSNLQSTVDDVGVLKSAIAPLFDQPLQNPEPQNGYYTAQVGEQIAFTSQSRSRAYVFDCSEYAGEKVSVKFTVSGTTSSTRASALCNSSGIVSDMHPEKYMTSSGFLFHITAEYNQLYVSFDSNISSNLVVTVLRDIDRRVTNIEKTVNPFDGLKYAAMGDSITFGFRPRNDTTDPSPLKSYAALVAERLDMVFANHGISASTVAYIADHNPMCRRYNDLPNDANIITVMGGVNDIRQGVPLGEMSDREDTTFYGALHTIFRGLYKKYYIDQGANVGRNVKIIAITPLKAQRNSPETSGGDGTLTNLAPYAEAIKEVAQYYSFPCLDMYNLSQLNPSICCTVQGTDPNSSGIYTLYQPDGTHPTQIAAEMMADLLEGFLKSIK